MKTYLAQHAQAFFESAGRLIRQPIATFMTVAVIAISLALPAGFYVLIDNLARVSRGWEGGSQISLFLKRDLAAKAAERLADRIRRQAQVTRVDYISPEAALAEFKRSSGFGSALDALDRNPLPPVLVVHPRIDVTPDGLEALVRELGQHPEVELAQLDLEWVRRLRALLSVAERGVWLLAALLAAGVILVTGNTIRLAVLSRKDEIEIIKLVGGTDAFIRRPFLHAGVQQGLAGALLAWGIVGLTLGLLAGPVRDLASLYGSDFQAEGLGAAATGVLLGAGALLGWVGSRLAVGRHLKAIEPK